MNRSRRIDHPLYNVWKSMIARCTRPWHRAWKNYGGRGIKICNRWMTFEWFRDDLEAQHRLGLTIDRINNDGDYEPGNVRFVTMRENQRNRRGLHWIEYGGQRWCFTSLAQAHGLIPQTLRRRINAGWSLEDALHRPMVSSEKPLTAFGQTLSRTQWAKKLGVALGTVGHRISHGWSLTDTLSLGPWERKAL